MTIREIQMQKGKEVSSKEEEGKKEELYGTTLMDFFFYTQKFDNHALVVHQTEELRWKQVSIEYMSEESDDKSDPLAIVVHQPEWRSKRNMYILFV